VIASLDGKGTMPTSKTKRGPNIWVVRRRAGFSIKEEGSRRYLIPPLPQRLATIIARLIARVNRSELIVQGEDGRIRARDSHGADPHPPKG
jgi:hypothetical protein